MTSLFLFFSFFYVFLFQLSRQQQPPIPICVLTTAQPAAFEKLINSGAEQFATNSNGSFSIVYEVYDRADYDSGFNEGLKKSEYLVAYGFDMFDPLIKYQGLYPEKKFVIIDVGVTLVNVIGVIFAEDEAGFLAGIIAGGVTKSKIVACIGGVAIGPVKGFCNGFHEAVLLVCPECIFLLDYAPGWGAIDWGVATGTHFVEQGADVIFGAGGGVGTAGIHQASKSPGVYVIGVDQDEYYGSSFQGSPESNKILTSAIKKADVGTYFALGAITKPDFHDGQVKTLAVEDGGVGVADCHETCDLWTDEINTTYAEIYSDMVSGRQSTGCSPSGDKIGTNSLQIHEFFPLHPSGFRPITRTEAVLCAFGGEKRQDVYLYGADVFYQQPDFYMYQWEQDDPNLNKPNNWTLVQVNGTAPPGRKEHSAVTYLNRYMIVFGGFLKGSVAVNDLLSFDTESNHWDILGPFETQPSPRHGHIAEVVADEMIIYGGVSDTLTLLNDVWSFNLETHTWKQLFPSGDRIPALQNCASAASDWSVFIFGGNSGDSLSDRLMIFNVSTSHWDIITVTSKVNPTARESAIIGFINSQLYLYGGFSSTEQADVWIYDQNIFEWREVTLKLAAESMSGHTGARVYDHDAKSDRWLVFGKTREVADGLMSFLPETAPTTDIIICDQKMKATVTGRFKDEWSKGRIRELYWCDGFYDCDNLYDEPLGECSPSISAVYVAFGVIEGVSILGFVCLSVWLFLNSTKSVVKSATPPFLHLMLVGAAIMLSVVYFAPAQPTDGICNALPWYFITGFHLMYGSLLVKNWRLAYIFNNKHLKVKAYNNTKLALKLFAWSIPDIILLILNTAINTPTAELQDQGYNNNDDKQHYQCNFGKIFFILLALYQAALVLYGAQLAWKIRHLNGYFNESRYIFLSIYTFLIVGLFMIPVIFLIKEPIARGIVLLIALTLVVDTTIALIFIPKILMANSDASNSGSRSVNMTARTTGLGSDSTEVEHLDQLVESFDKLKAEQKMNYFREMNGTFPGLIGRTSQWMREQVL